MRRVIDPRWTSATFLMYAGGVTALLAMFALLAVIHDDHGDGARAGFSVLFFLVPLLVALALHQRERRVAAGVFAFVAVLLFAYMVASFWTWFGWLDESEDGFEGFDVARLSVYLLTLFAAVMAIRHFRTPWLALIAAALTWLFVTDLVSGGGDWTAVVSLLIGLAFLVAGLALDGGEARPYGFWWHVAAGLLIAGSLANFWTDGDGDWWLMILLALLFIVAGSGMRRSSYAVIGALILAAATGHYTDQAVPNPFSPGGGGGTDPWVSPLGFLFLGFFLALVGLFLARRDREPEAA